MQTNSAWLMGRDAYDSSKARAPSCCGPARDGVPRRGRSGSLALPTTFLTFSKVISDCFAWRGQVIKLRVIKLAASMLSLVALAALATPVHGEDDFPLIGTYTENQACK